MAKERGVKRETIITHLEELKMTGRITAEALERLGKGNKQLKDIQTAFKKLNTYSLKPVFDHFEGAASYADIRLARLLLPE